MAEYVQSNIEVSISEACFEKAYYIHFGRFEYIKKDNSTYVSKIVFDENDRYIIDESTINNTFPSLCSNSFYDKTKLTLGVKDSYLGSKVTNNEFTIISIIYPNEFFDKSINGNTYKFAFITGKSTTSIDSIDIPDSYRYNIDNINRAKDNIEQVNRLIKLYDNSKWLYLMDCQNISNIWCSYIIHFYIKSSIDTNSSIEDISIKLHTISEQSHNDCLSVFANDISTQKTYSYYTLNNSLKSTYSKMNGLLTALPLQNRLVFYGTPYGYSSDNFETVSINDMDAIKSSYYNDLLNFVNERKHNTNKSFGNNQINSVSARSGSYEQNPLTEEEENNRFNEYIKKYKKSIDYANIKYSIKDIFDIKDMKFEYDNNFDITIHYIADKVISEKDLKDFKEKYNYINEITLHKVDKIE